MNESERFFTEVKGLYLPVLTNYHHESDGGPTYPWIANNRIGLQAGLLYDLEAADPVTLYPDNLFAPSCYREGGFALWDFIIRNGRTSLRTAKDHANARGIADKSGAFPKPLNLWWLQSVAQAYMHNQLPSLPYYRDLRCTDWTLVEAAHALAHRFGDAKVPAISFWKSYSYLSRIFVQYLADLYVASEFGIPIDIYQPPGETLAWGVVARPTLRIGFAENRPVLQQPYSYSLKTDRDFAHVSVAIEVGHDPASIVTPGAALTEHDSLGYQPARLFCVGWTLSPWVYGQDLRWPEQLGWGDREKAAFTVLCEDLFAPQAFPRYLDLASQEPRLAPIMHRQLADWREELGGLISMTETLPCDWCLLFNRQVDNGIQLASRKWKWKTTDPQEKAVYKQKLRDALKLVEKAKVKVYGREYRTLRRDRKGRHKALRTQRRNEAKACKKNPYGYWR
jgi:hypothetical protein